MLRKFCADAFNDLFATPNMINVIESTGGYICGLRRNERGAEKFVCNGRRKRERNETAREIWRYKCTGTDNITMDFKETVYGCVLDSHG